MASLLEVSPSPALTLSTPEEYARPSPAVVAASWTLSPETSIPLAVLIDMTPAVRSSPAPARLDASSSLPLEKLMPELVARSTATSSAETAIPSPPTTSMVFPVLVIPAPAVIWPAPENCANTRSSVPTTSDPASLVHTKPLPSSVPASMKVKTPAAPLGPPTRRSSTRVGAPESAIS